MKKTGKALDQFIKYGQTRRYRKGQVLSDEYRARKALCFIVSGSAELFVQRGAQTGRMIFWRLFPGDYYGQECIVGKEQSGCIVIRARTEVVVSELSFIRLNKLLQTTHRQYREPMLMQMAADYCDRLSAYLAKIESVYTQSVYARVRDALLQLAEYPDALSDIDGVVPAAFITELAEWSGCQRRQASKMVARMIRNGLVRKRRSCIMVLGENITQPGDLRPCYRFKLAEEKCD